jgi:tRNA (cytidine/uridine-2'-O-)-methyltransferase
LNQNIQSRLRIVSAPAAGDKNKTKREKAGALSSMPEFKIALYQPDIPGNTGTILRFAACMGLSVDIIEPAGFILSDKNLRRAGMDYIASVTMTRHVNFAAFEAWRQPTGRRLVLASTKAAVAYTQFEFRPDDILLLGRESAGVPDHVHDQADARILIPMGEGQRSINVALSAAMITGEALRQTDGFEKTNAALA